MSETIFLNLVDRTKRVHVLFKDVIKSGYDDVPCYLIKETVNQIAIVLTFVINISFESGIFPS